MAQTEKEKPVLGRLEHMKSDIERALDNYEAFFIKKTLSFGKKTDGSSYPYRGGIKKSKRRDPF